MEYKSVDEIGIEIEHCSSCHHEWDEGYRDFDELVVELDGETFYISDSCCGVQEALEKNNIPYEYL